jgi:hypothetical protein
MTIYSLEHRMKDIKAQVKLLNSAMKAGVDCVEIPVDLPKTEKGTLSTPVPFFPFSCYISHFMFHAPALQKADHTQTLPRCTERPPPRVLPGNFVV